MKRLFYLLIIFLALCCSGQSQTPQIDKKHSSNQYKDVVFDSEKIWALTISGKLALFDIDNGGQLRYTARNSSAITVLTKDRNGNIIIGDKSNSIRRYTQTTNSWTTLFSFENTLLGIAFDSKNDCYLITDKGIYDDATKKHFYPDSAQNYQIRHSAGWFREPTYIIDKNDNIWIGFGYGEWGGQLFIFSTRERKFINPDLKDFPITLNPIKSIFESEDHVFVTSGLMHFFTRGSIARFDSFQSQLVFESEDHRKFPNDSTNEEMVSGEYIGPGAYNSKDSCIYFYSQNGIFRGNPKTNLSKIENWTKVLQPKLRWTNGQPDAVGSPMNVLRIKFIESSRLIFVSQGDGIGIYDGKTLIMIR